jgi:farnesyl diphosphate synthase
MNNTKIQSYLIRHESVLHDIVNCADIPATRIKDAMLYSLFPGGKRLRPMLVYLCGELLSVTLPTLDIIAASIELIHCYSLIHDDLPAMDNDDFRRGKPSCHRAFDEATAILVGDGMQALAIDILLTHLPKSLDLEQVLKISLELTKACGVSGMVSGQSLDLSELSKVEINEHQLTEIHTLKTSHLMQACINMTLLAANPSPPIITALQEFSKNLGLVFQMQDDYLDCYGDKDTLGKGRASDTINQKITFASLYEKNTLSARINQLFQLTLGALTPFENHADDLKALIRNLQHRILFK